MEKEFKLPERWAVRITDQNKEILKAWRKLQPDVDLGYNINASIYLVSQHEDRSYLLYSTRCEEHNYTEISFENFMKYVLKWYINRENYSIVQEWFTENTTTKRDYSEELLGWYTHYPSFGTNNYTQDCVMKGYVGITFEEFKKYILGNDELINETMKERKIIGYKLTKPEYEKVALEITKMHSSETWADNLRMFRYMFSINSLNEKKLKEAGVLDLWFIPVYAEEEFKVGDWVMFDNTIKNGPYQLCKKQPNYFKDSNGNFRNISCGHYRKATYEEVEKHLLDEVEKKYGKDSYFRCLRNNVELKLISAYVVFANGNYLIRNLDQKTIYKNNKWAVKGVSKWFATKDDYREVIIWEDRSIPSGKLFNTKDEAMLEHAKLKYPVGTKFKSAYSGDVMKIEKDSYRNDECGITIKNPNSSEIFLYYNTTGRWAEIVEEPENEFPFGNITVVLDYGSKFAFVNRDNGNVVGMEFGQIKEIYKYLTHPPKIMTFPLRINNHQVSSSTVISFGCVKGLVGELTNIVDAINENSN